MRSSPCVRVARRIDADPTSTALLLAGPTAVDLWPGVRRIGEIDGRLLVQAPSAAVTAAAPDAGDADRPALVAVHAPPPTRTPTAYVTRFSWSSAPRVGTPVPAVTGRLTLAYAPTCDGTPVTHAVLELELEQPTDAPPELAADPAADSPTDAEPDVPAGRAGHRQLTDAADRRGRRQDDRWANGQPDPALARMAQGFLANLARAAETRNRAA